MTSAEEKLKRRLSSLIKGDAAAKFNSWQAPSMEGNTINKDTRKPSDILSHSSGTQKSPGTAESLEQISKQAYEEGYQKGLQAGHKDGSDSLNDKLLQIDTVLASLSSKSKEFDEKITLQLVEMTTLIAKHVIRQELNSSPEMILAIVQQVLSMMPVAVDNMVLKLHPSDATLLKESFEIEDMDDFAWKLFEDPTIQRGGCILSSDSSQINAQLDQRIETVVNKLIGSSKSDE